MARQRYQGAPWLYDETTGDTDVSIAYHAPETSPAKPAAPSLLLTVSEVAA